MTSENPEHGARKSHRIVVLAFILFFTSVSAYLALVIVTHIESVFFPGNGISIPGGKAVAPFLPGIDVTGSSGSQKRINLLIVGIDRRPSDGPVLTRTDSIEIATIDPKTKSATILGVPRDLWVDIPRKNGGTYKDRINTSLVVGQSEQYPEGPFGLMKEVVENNLHISIDHYVAIDFNGFRGVIDGLGGIDVVVPDEVYDPYYSESELPGDYNPQHFYPGTQHMDGETALAYSRIRFSSDDLDRIQRQQRVIFATIAKAESLDVLKNAPSLWNKYKDTIQTDISDFQVPGYALLAKQAESNIRSLSLGPAMTPYTTAAGADVLLGDPKTIQQIVDAAFSDQTTSPDALPKPAPVRVELENGTGIDGLAAHVIDFLASHGYVRTDLVAANSFDQATHGTSSIVDVDGSHQRQALLLAQRLGIAVSAVRQATSAEQDELRRSGAQLLVMLATDQDFATLRASAPAAP